MKSLLPKINLLAILLLALFVRFYDVNWDQGNHLHPDERFLTMVAIDMKLPPSFSAYLDTEKSTFNPANVNYPFYVYGIFPVVLAKLLALDIKANNYMDFTILGRMLSGFFDVIVVLLVYKIAELFEKEFKFNKNTKYWSAFFYSIAVLPIQLAHFFAVDTFLNTFTTGAFYFILRYYFSKKYWQLICSGILLGLAIATKISGLYAMPLIIFLLVLSTVPSDFKKLKPSSFNTLLISGFLFILSAYITIRFTDPYIFQHGTNFFDPRINKSFIDNLKALQSWSTPEAWFPPSVQWIHKAPVLFALQNLVFFGMGVGFALLSFWGGVLVYLKDTKWLLRGILFWVLLYFLYESIQFSKTMRYFIIIYPFLAIYAAVAYSELTKKWHYLLKTLLIIFVLIWPLFFFSIYTKEHSRTTASRWIYQNIPNNSLILSEHWDDALPIAITPPSPKHYTDEEMHVFDPDTPQKWAIMNAQMKRANYIILSSNRGWGSMPTVPERYPLMKQYYADLLANKTNYKKIAEFTSYPSLSYLGLPITFADDWGEEAYTVIDHPKVMIFKKQ